MTTQLNDAHEMAILNGEVEAPNDGIVAPLDGASSSHTASSARMPLSIDGKPAASAQEALAKLALGANNERLEELRPDLVNALRELVVEYRQEGMVARRHEIRRIRQARLFWQGLQYAWWNPQDMTWHLPYESKMYDDSAAAEMPRYQFVTNLYRRLGCRLFPFFRRMFRLQMIDQQLSQQNNMNQQIYRSARRSDRRQPAGIRTCSPIPAIRRRSNRPSPMPRSRRCRRPSMRWRKTPRTAPRERATPRVTES